MENAIMQQSSHISPALAAIITIVTNLTILVTSSSSARTSHRQMSSVISYIQCSAPAVYKLPGRRWMDLQIIHELSVQPIPYTPPVILYPHSEERQ